MHRPIRWSVWKVWIPTLVALSLLGSSAYAIPAFPGAEGFGAITPGGRGGTVYVVTNLNNSGPGSFRAACEASGTRTVVFAISGKIQLLTELSVTNPYITIAGQTAPGDGVCISGETFSLDTHDIIVRHLRFRRGTDVTTRSDDALGSDRTTGNIIVDHCSASWGLDENLSIYRYKDASGSVYPTKNVTIQYSVSSEALNINSHAFGATWGGTLCSYHHNLFACNTGRNPSISFSYLLDLRNNVLFNWDHRTMDGAGPEAHVNVVNNYYKYGPAVDSNDLKYRIVKPEIRSGEPGYGEAGWWYVEGNYVWGFPTITANNWAGGVQFELPMDPNDARSLVPFAAPSLAEDDTAEEAYLRVLAEAGATRPGRDAVDTRIMGMVAAGTVTYSNGIINYPSNVGGYPNYPVVFFDPNIYDPDKDGMLSNWEQAHGLDPNVADNNGDDDADGFTNLEEYLSDLAAWPAPRPIVWLGGSAGTAGRYELMTNWDIPWQPTLADQVEINSGKATVAYPNQEAGTLYVGNSAGGSAELAVTAGKLSVGNNLVLGSTTNSNGTLTVSGGTLVVGNTLRVSNASSAMGIVTLSGGSISGYRTYVGASGMGTFVQTAGTHQLSNSLFVGGETNPQGTGHYTLSGGLLRVGNSLYVGVEGVGSFLQTGGSVDVVDNLSLGTGYYRLGGSGKVRVGNEVNLGSRGVMDILGGSLTASGPIVLASGASSAAELTVAKNAYVQVGGLTINSGGGRSTKVSMELDANGHSLIRTTGAATLAGTLNVQRLGSYRPSQGDAFTLILATSGAGNFGSITSNITEGLLLKDPCNPGLGYWPAFRGGFDAIAEYVVTFQGAMAGDTGGDNQVTSADLSDLTGNWGQSGVGWAQGDFGGDGNVTSADLSDLTGNWGVTGLPPSAPPPLQAPVPEPATLALLAGGTVVGFLRKDGRRRGFTPRCNK
jgi:hypothetical protein